ncbi:sporulation integral membrane protein YtvI [Virgibacillus halodenitrificans]|uniref:sporulation integral membrane protein YtvI n=1 Tax=Virgibacillus halodenitrificans TaxID=1482 RepID=UPI000EF52D41|nr:sporulation integral membrane protein YtvI [Virgibacillus halodenitrificans]
MNLVKDNNKIIRFLKVLGITSASVLLGFLAIQLLYPFLIAFLLAYLVNPLVNLLEKRVKLSRGISVSVSMIIVIGSLLVGIFYLSIELVAGIQYLITMFPSKIEHFSYQLNLLMADHILPLFNEVSNIFNQLNGDQQQDILEQIKSAKNGIIESTVVLLKEFMQGLLTFVQGLPNIAASFLFGLLGTFFISKDWYKIKSWIVKLLPKSVKTKGETIGKGLKIALFGYLKSQVILVVIITITIIIGLFILGVNHAITIGILIGMLDFLPFFGTGFVLIPWSICSLINGKVFLGIGLPILYLVLVIVRNLVEPKVLSFSTGLNTLATIISMYVGLKLFGFAGLFLGPITLIIVTTFIKVNVFQDVWRYIQGK